MPMTDDGSILIDREFSRHEILLGCSAQLQLRSTRETIEKWIVEAVIEYFRYTDIIIHILNNAQRRRSNVLHGGMYSGIYLFFIVFLC